jgi:hypothetical protein
MWALEDRSRTCFTLGDTLAFVLWRLYAKL